MLFETPERLKGKKTPFTLVEKYLNRHDEPLNLPRGLFRELIVKALLTLGDGRLKKEVQQAIEQETKRQIPTSVSYLIDLYFQLIQRDGYQEFYCYDLPNLQNRIDESHAQGWQETRWAQNTGQRIRSEQGDITRHELMSRLEGLWKDRTRKLNHFAQDLAKQMRYSATQDQVLFLAAKRLIDLNYANRRNQAEQDEAAHTNPFEKIKLQTLSRNDLNASVEHGQPVVNKTDPSQSKTIYVGQIKAKNIGTFKRLARDRRLPGILHYYDAEKIHLSVVHHELQAYPRAQNQAFAEVLAFEENQNNRQRLKADALPQGQSLHRTLVEQRLQQNGMPHAQQDALKDEALTLRNAFCHNQTPAPENAKGNKGDYASALPMLNEARQYLSAARQDASSIDHIKGGHTVAEHFSGLLSDRYKKLKGSKT